MSDGMEFEFDPFAPEFHSDPYPSYRYLLAEQPVHHSKTHDMWFVARYADVLGIFRDTNSYSNVTRTSSGFLPMIATMDPPRHDALRGILAGAFMPGRLSRLSSFVRDTAKALLESIRERRNCDFIADFATEIPTRVTCHLLGMPEEMREQFRLLTDRIFSTFDSEGGLQPDIATPIYALADELIELKRKKPSDDLTTRLAFAKIEDKELSHEELLGYMLQLIAAGFETTRGLLGNTMWLLAEHPDQRRLLRNAVNWVPGAIEESLRVESPTPMIFRAAKMPVSIQSRPIPEGALVVPMMASANRDPLVFDRPESFDVQRRRNPVHLAFGAGIHFCLGNHLARLEAIICLEEVLRILPDWHVVKTGVRRHQAPIARGFLSLPLELDARAT